MFNHTVNIIIFSRGIQICMSAVQIQNFLDVFHKRTVYLFVIFYKLNRNCLLSIGCCTNSSVHTAFVYTVLFLMHFFHDTAGRSHIRHTVNQNEFTHRFMILKFIDDNAVCQ